jgi:hypothetical protein
MERYLVYSSLSRSGYLAMRYVCHAQGWLALTFMLPSDVRHM